MNTRGLFAARRRLLCKCFDDDFDPPCPWVRHLLLLQPVTLDVCTPARLCVDIPRPFCSILYGPDSTLKPSGKRIHESSERIDERARGWSSTRVGVQPGKRRRKRTVPNLGRRYCGRGTSECLGERGEEDPVRKQLQLVVWKERRLDTHEYRAPLVPPIVSSATLDMAIMPLITSPPVMTPWSRTWRTPLD
jgi:hypothetical protein